MVRSHNEDSVFGNPHRGLVILADGMGGYNAGEVASGMATTVLSTELENAFVARSPDTPEADGGRYAQAAIRDRVARANAAIFNAAASQPQYAGMGTTLVLALFHDNRLTAAHIGDSRLYRLRGDALAQLTRDHSLLQEQIDAGMISAEEARHSQNKNLVTRALGVDPQVETEIHDHEVLPGDLYLLCSDGLNDMVEDDEIALTLQSLGANLELAATQLIQMANDNGGRDNVSVILVKVLREFPAATGWWAKFLNCFK
ncbi:Stp1/IreP family PP2C-type Ser/Thr phosphatase [Azospira restricta]|uniref:Stp1/IreP family PP2C-type Ser/Thr phosphatase n=2 Tax=Azospira restricta TaxID=404405 RepID=A0A974SSM4_9RHOO|nr:Stp1/IreP family PP2C-type Ser/Thr phosphatase [Azospira restricta]